MINNLTELERGMFIASTVTIKTSRANFAPVKIKLLDNALVQSFFPDMEVVNARLHILDPWESIPNHVDDGYPDCDAYICRLDEYAKPRLTINNVNAEERAGVWIKIEQGVTHGVIAAPEGPQSYQRYSLVVFAKAKT